MALRQPASLTSALREHLREMYDANIGDWKVHVLIFLNQEGLAQTLHASGLVSNARDRLQAFVQGFNNGQSLFHMEDVGSAKEAADRKVRSSFELMAYNRQCRHYYLLAAATITDIYRGSRTSRAIPTSPMSPYSRHTRLALAIPLWVGKSGTLKKFSARPRFARRTLHDSHTHRKEPQSTRAWIPPQPRG